MPVRFRVAYGGRGSSKSWEFARRSLIKGIEKKHKILCTREIQKSIKNSIHALLRNQIGLLGLGGNYQHGENYIKSTIGTEYIYAGLRHNVDSIKSTEGVSIAIVEEAQNVSKKSWETLIPTVREEGSEIWVSFNTDQEDDAAYQMFVENRLPGSVVELVNYERNPFLTGVLRREMEQLKKVDYEAYLHIWEGQLRAHSDAQIFKGMYRVEEFQPGDDWQGPYQGADWGFSVDPTTLNRMWIHDQTLYLEYEAHAVGCKLDNIGALFDQIPDARKTKIRADCSRPETIAHVKDQKFIIEGAKKWPGSVEDGVEFIRSFRQVVIHPRCKNTADEFKLYSYKVDKNTDDVTTIIEDKHNHHIDSIRYALQPMISKGITPMNINLGSL